jgi:hypothetical protein
MEMAGFAVGGNIWDLFGGESGSVLEVEGCCGARYRMAF